MKIGLVSNRPRHWRKAFTLPELLVGVGVAMITGGLAYTVYSTGQVLFGRNMATNLPTESSRVAFNHFLRDMHLNIGPTQLINASLANVSGNGPSAGVSLRYYAGGPCILMSDVAASSTTIVISPSTGFTPTVGDLVSLPAFRLERIVTAVQASGSNWRLTLASSIGQAFNNTSSTNYVAFVTREIAYAVVGSNLRRYPNLAQPSTFTVVARGITSPQPFSIPVSGGVPDPRYISVSLSTTNMAYTHRNWASVDSALNYTVAYRTPTLLTTQ